MSVATYGHTPGHNSHIVSSGSAAVYVQADVTNNPALFVRNPGWHAFLYAQERLRHAGDGEDDGARLPLSVPVGCLH
jgi:hypothetical protein